MVEYYSPRQLCPPMHCWHWRQLGGRRGAGGNLGGEAAVGQDFNSLICTIPSEWVCLWRRNRIYDLRVEVPSRGSARLTHGVPLFRPLNWHEKEMSSTSASASRSTMALSYILSRSLKFTVHN